MGIGDGHDLKSPRFAGDPILEACFDGEHRMVLGEEGDAVKAIQQALVDLNYLLPLHGIDSKYGDETAGQVARFKREHGITPSDGVVGPKTMAALDALFPPPPPISLDTLKAKWFLDFSQPSTDLPPVARYPSSTIGVWTDGNHVETLMDGQEYMKEWYDALIGMSGHSGSEYYHANWLTNDVRVLGESYASSSALNTLIYVFGNGVKFHLLLSGQDPQRLVNQMTIDYLANANVKSAFLDTRYPQSGTIGSNHQKFYIFKAQELGKYSAFIGSIDINTARWDRDLHMSNDPERGSILPVPSSGSGARPTTTGRVGPSHDFGIKVTGPAVPELEQSFRDRWRDPTLNPPPTPPILTPLSPPGAAVGSHSVQMLHTYGRTTIPPGYSWSPTGEFTIWAAYLKAIKAATTYIYLEDQYFLPFDSPPRFNRPPGQREADIVFQLGEAIKRSVKVIVLVPEKLEEPVISGFIRDQRALGVFYLAQIAIAEAAAGRTGDFLIASLNNGIEPIFVHSKLMICDDEYVNLGSANVNQRSMTHDSEINIAVLDAGGAFARDLRKRLWTHYVGSPTGLHNFSTAYPIFKASVLGKVGRLRPFSMEPVKPGYGHDRMMKIIDPYAGPPRP
jgi:phosphatidylserine/phosphatidylglycerophosphate/cardiolipin synthase-like enzyme